MNRYEKGQIYKVVDIGYNMCYIGSTCQSLSKRFYKHKENITNTPRARQIVIEELILFLIDTV